MNEYRVPELNVQNGVLKSLSFLFEYIGEMGKDYIYAVTPLLEDALMDRLDTPVKRFVTKSFIEHLFLSVATRILGGFILCSSLKTRTIPIINQTVLFKHLI